MEWNGTSYWLLYETSIQYTTKTTNNPYVSEPDMGSTLGLIRRSNVGGAFKNIDTQNTNGTRCTHCGNFGTYANTGASYTTRGCKENCIILGRQ